MLLGYHSNSECAYRTHRSKSNAYSSQVEESSMAGMGTYDYVKDPKV